ncbi:uncharacterized protein LOC119442716 [Dermacentor silvarum]|uniref:uncharacterized protein LOC119442716 n=1 Tax=Dermacentor silvarum TaxID=543639 RepID=UPI002101AF53|nr:uncharacterized protein LOC119442716 [Dermacentor silvarum]
MQQVDAEIRQCVDRGKPLTSILYSPPGRARRHSQPFAERTGAAANVGRSQQRPRQLPRGCSSRCPPPASGLRWLDTPHAVSVTRGMRGTQQLTPFDDGPRAPGLPPGALDEPGAAVPHSTGRERSRSATVSAGSTAF